MSDGAEGAGPRSTTWLWLVPAVVGSGLLALIFQRAWDGRATTDWIRVLLLVLSLWVLVPFVLTTARLDGWRAWSSRLIDGLDRVAFQHTGWFVLGWVLLWLVTNTLYSATLAEAKYGIDLTFYLQAASNAVDPRGPFWMTFDGSPHSYLSHHFEPFLYLFQPLGKLPFAPAAINFIHDLAQGAFLWLALVIIREHLTTVTMRVAVMVLLVLNPYWSGLIHFEFHEYGFVPVMVLLAYQAWQRRSWWLWLSACLGLALLRETMSFALAWAGLLLAVQALVVRDRVRVGFGVAALIFGVAQYLLYFRVVLPAVAGRSWTMYSDMYAALGNSPFEIVMSPLLRTEAFLRAVFQPDALRWLAIWGLSMGIVGCLGWRWFLLIVPEIALLWLADSTPRHATIFHYGGLILPVMVVAMVHGGMTIERGTWSARRRGMLLAVSVLGAVMVTASVVPRRLAGLVGEDGVRKIPLVASIPARVPFVSNTMMGLMHGAGHAYATQAAGVEVAPQGNEWVLQPDTVFLLDDRHPFAGKERLIEVRRHGAWGLYRWPSPQGAATDGGH